MNVRLSNASKKQTEKSIQITGSKSETNRWLILQALYRDISLHNRSNSDDSRVLQKALVSSEEIIDIHHAGTAMRFLTAYFSTQEHREVVLTGSERMQQRPVGVLVDALRQLGADISYVHKDGFPPLRIKGKKLTKNQVSMQAAISSQFISALLLIAPSLPQGLEINLIGTITSRPYIEMTLAQLKQLGVAYHFNGNTITVQPLQTIKKKDFTIESDWSSASYYFSLVALSDDRRIRLKSFQSQSVQGDRALVELYKPLGVVATFSEEDSSILLQKTQVKSQGHYTADLAETPDIAQTIAVTCFGLGISCTLTGLHTLKIKETDRLQGLKNELEKLGAQVRISEKSIEIAASEHIASDVEIQTYQDHRMAMAFAPLSQITNLRIEEASVVSKSYPGFWEDFKSLGIHVEPY